MKVKYRVEFVDHMSEGQFSAIAQPCFMLEDGGWYCAGWLPKAKYTKEIEQLIIKAFELGMQHVAAMFNTPSTEVLAPIDFTNKKQEKDIKHSSKLICSLSGKMFECSSCIHSTEHDSNIECQEYCRGTNKKSGKEVDRDTKCLPIDITIAQGLRKSEKRAKSRAKKIEKEKFICPEANHLTECVGCHHIKSHAKIESCDCAMCAGYDGAGKHLVFDVACRPVEK